MGLFGPWARGLLCLMGTSPIGLNIWPGLNRVTFIVYTTVALIANGLHLGHSSHQLVESGHSLGLYIKGQFVCIEHKGIHGQMSTIEGLLKM